MAVKIKVNGSTVTLNTGFKFEDLKLVEQYCPSVLEACDETGEVAYKIATTTGKSSLSSVGAVFSENDISRTTGNCIVTLPYEVDTEASVDDIKSDIGIRYGAAVDYLNAIANSIEENVATANAKKEAIASNIEIVD